jgi:predicted amidophosphoribosyltransferase
MLVRVALLDLLFPQRCIGCGEPRSLFCAGCRASLPLLRGPCCARCGAPSAWPISRCRECARRRLSFASARAAVPYHGAGRLLVVAWKEHALRTVAPLAAELVTEVVARPPAQTLTFVPPDRDRALHRGHHPAERLALELGRCWGLPVERLLGRACVVRPQRGLSLADRRRNVRGAFRARGRVPRAVALVDDVYTTGATAQAAASALRAAGARRVDVVTFARAVRS